MRVIICGGGVDTPEDADTALAAALDELHARRRFTTVGLRASTADGPTDMVADVWVDQNGIDRALFPETTARGAFADHDRNRLMLTTLRPEMVVIVPGGPDTTNLAHQARGMKIKVVEITPSPENERGEDATDTGAGAAPAVHGKGKEMPPGGSGRPGARRPARGRSKDPT